MFIDELIIQARAGKGGDGVVRWLREHGRPWGGPAGGNGGRGGNVLVRAVRDNNVLSRYTGEKLFAAGDGEAGHSKSKYGKNGEDMVIDVPRGSRITNLSTGRTYELLTEGEIVEILRGGAAGLGNEHFKSSTNRAPLEHTQGKAGESASFRIEVALVVDVGIVGLPNAGKSTLLNALTRASSRVGAYPFTTLSPHLGDLYGITLADIPGLIEGASEGKGLGHTFLRHVSRARMLVHCVSLEHEDAVGAYQSIRAEMARFDASLLEKREWVVLTKSDLVADEQARSVRAALEAEGVHEIYVTASDNRDSLKALADALTSTLRGESASASIA